MKAAKIKFIFGSTVFLSTLPLIAKAQDDVAQLYSYVGDFYTNLLLPIGGTLAGFVIIYGAILYSLSAGDASKVGRAKEFIFGAISGLVLLFLAWFIVRFVIS